MSRRHVEQLLDVRAEIEAALPGTRRGMAEPGEPPQTLHGPLTVTWLWHVSQTRRAYSGGVSTIDLPDHVAARFAAEAKRRGVTIDQLLAFLVERLPDGESDVTGGAERRLGFINLGSSASGLHARDANEIFG